MAVILQGVTTVLLPGTGSDDDYVYRAFSAALHDAGAVVVTPRPQPERLVDGYHDALDNARSHLADRGRRSVDRRGGGHRVGDCSSGTRSRGPRCAPRLDGRTGQRAGGDSCAPLGECAATRRAGLGHCPDAGGKPTVAGRRVDPLVGRPVAGAARRHGRGRRRSSPPRAASWRGWRFPWGWQRPRTTLCTPWRSPWSGCPRRLARRCARSHSTRWASTLECSARRA